MTQKAMDALEVLHSYALRQEGELNLVQFHNAEMTRHMQLIVHALMAAGGGEMSPMVLQVIGLRRPQDDRIIMRLEEENARLKAKLAAVKSDKTKSPETLPRTAPGYMVWNPAANMPRHRHIDLNNARTEAERLAKTHPNAVFYIMAPVSYAIVKTRTHVERLPLESGLIDQVDVALDDDIPF